MFPCLLLLLISNLFIFSMDSGRKCLIPGIPSFLVNVLYLTIACTQTQPQGKPSVVAHGIKSKCLSMIFKVLSNLGPVNLSDFSSRDAFVIQCHSCPWNLTNSLICQVQSCFCGFIQPVSSIQIIFLFLLCLVQTIHPLKHRQMKWNLYIIPLSNMIDTSNGRSTS